MGKNQIVQEESKELTQVEFKELANDLKPVLKSMEAVLKKHNIECLTSISMSADGYFNFSLHDSDWEFKRLSSDAKMLICKSITEEV